MRVRSELRGYVDLAVDGALLDASAARDLTPADVFDALVPNGVIPANGGYWGTPRFVRATHVVEGLELAFTSILAVHAARPGANGTDIAFWKGHEHGRFRWISDPDGDESPWTITVAAISPRLVTAWARRVGGRAWEDEWHAALARAVLLDRAEHGLCQSALDRRARAARRERDRRRVHAAAVAAHAAEVLREELGEPPEKDV